MRDLFISSHKHEFSLPALLFSWMRIGNRDMRPRLNKLCELFEGERTSPWPMVQPVGYKDLHSPACAVESHLISAPVGLSHGDVSLACKLSRKRHCMDWTHSGPVGNTPHSAVRFVTPTTTQVYEFPRVMIL